MIDVNEAVLKSEDLQLLIDISLKVRKTNLKNYQAVEDIDVDNVIVGSDD